MGIINSNKSIGNVSFIDCQGVLDVTIGVTAAPDIRTNPTDIVLLLDRSTSMTGQSLADLKTGVNAFIDIIAAATEGAPDQIGSGSRIGVVSFASTATRNTELITSVAALKAAAAALAAGGETNHSAAFTEATALLSASTNDKVIVMFTDGKTTAGPNASPFAAAARALGISIYCIGLQGLQGIDVNALNDWATDPNVTHVAVAPNSAQLQQIFADLAANISVPGATNIVINEMVNPDFQIVTPPVASVGVLSQLTATSFQWAIGQLGTTATESATVTFSVRHVAAAGGVKPINQSLTYTDTQGNSASFAAPTVTVSCIPDNARLAVTKSADKTSVCAASEDITYSVAVSNPGNVPLTNVMVYDSIPQGLCYKPGTTRVGAAAAVDANPQSGIYVGNLAPGGSATVTFVMNVCMASCSGSGITGFVNTAWARGSANQMQVNAVSDPLVVAFGEARVSKNIERCLMLPGLASYRQEYVCTTGMAYYETATGGVVRAGYSVVINYLDRCGVARSKYLDGCVIFSDLPSGFNAESAKIQYTGLTHENSCGNVVIKFEAVLCYCAGV